MDKKLFGTRINKARKDRGLTAEKLAEACNINSTYLRQIEGGKKLPSLPVFATLCRELRVSPNYTTTCGSAAPTKSRTGKSTSTWPVSITEEDDMYLMGRDEYECDICGFREKWDAHDDHRGDMWECERCGKHFCTNCFKKACGEEDFRKMLSETDNVLCPECWQNQSQKKEFSINIRETLETQVAVEAENEEAALREVERRWKNGEYILDADNFQGADFWAADHPPVKQIDAQEKINWFELFLSRMRDYSDGEVWGIGDELMCKTEAIADAMCDLLFQLYAAQGEEVVFHTGYYDPAEDARSGEEDRCTGWWYVDCD